MDDRKPWTGIIETVAEWRRRDEAYGRMIEALQAGDDAAYERARRDFWSLSDADIPSTPTPSVLEDTGREVERPSRP